MKTYLTLLAALTFTLAGVSCTMVEDQGSSASVTKETTTTIDPLSGTASTQTTTTTVRRSRD